MTFMAEYPGTCEVCDGLIRRGEWIDRVPGGYAHLRCERSSAPREVCPVCFLEVTPSGVCGCEVTR